MNQIIERVTTEAELPEMSKEEAEQYHGRICSSMNEWAFYMLVFKLRKGYKQMGYSSFEKYCETCTDMAYRTVDNWLVKIIVMLRGKGLSASDPSKVAIDCNFSEPLLPVAVSQVMHKLPEDKFPEAWSLFYNGGVAGLPLKQQMEALQRWQQRAGVVETPIWRKAEPEDEELQSSQKGCAGCGVLIDALAGPLCSRCQWKKEHAPADMPADDPVAYFFSPPQPVEQTPKVTGLKAEGIPVTHSGTQEPDMRLMDFSRLCVEAADVLVFDRDPRYLFVRVQIPNGVTYNPGDILTVAVNECQMPAEGFGR